MALTENSEPGETPLNGTLDDEIRVITCCLAKYKLRREQLVYYKVDDSFMEFDPKRASERTPGFLESTGVDFLVKNRSGSPVFPKQVGETHLICPSQEEIDAMLVQKDKSLPFTKRSHFSWSPSFLYLSRVGFDPDVTQALVSVCIVVGPLMGDGSLYYCTLESEGWRISKTLGLWQM